MTLDTTYPFSADAFRQRVTERFTSRADVMAAMASDGKLNPDYLEQVKTCTFRDAAVLIPVIDRGGEATVLLTQRTEHLSSHSGQVAFPGGKIDEGEAPIEAALREAEEEVGLAGDQIEVLGAFGDYYSGSGYKIVPVVGMVSPDAQLSLNENEVAAAFEVPLSFLMNEDNHGIESRTFKGNERHFYAMPWQDEAVSPSVERRIWGVTAGIIQMMHERLYGDAR